ncbi:hypothetical protein [Microbacterium sp. NPDC055683]
MDRIDGLGIVDLLRGALSLPIVSVVLAAIVAGLFLVLRSGAPVRERYLAERRVLGYGALTVVIVTAAETTLRDHVLPLADVAAWWHYPVPLVTSALVLVASLIVIRSAPAPSTPAGPSARRAWTSFGSKALFVSGGVLTGVLLATTLAAGLVSTSDDRGRYVLLDLPVANTRQEPLRPWFFGWTYGIPVLIGMALLALAVWLALRENALRPFAADDIGGQRAQRAQIGTAMGRLATGAVLVVLGGAWRFIGESGGPATLTVGDDPVVYETTWRWSEYAVIAGAIAPVLEIIGFVLLFFTARVLPAASHVEKRATVPA